jgi:hypothetical protein
MRTLCPPTTMTIEITGFRQRCFLRHVPRHILGDRLLQMKFQFLAQRGIACILREQRPQTYQQTANSTHSFAPSRLPSIRPERPPRAGPTTSPLRLGVACQLW